MKSRNVKPSRKAVAKKANVSEATVSRVFNNPSSVSADKVKCVRDAAEKLGYVPDKNASALRRNGTGVILFLEKITGKGYEWPEIHYYNWFYGEIIRKLSKAVDKTLYHLRLYTVTSNTEIAELGNKNICDGIIGFNIDDSATVLALKKTGIPHICCGHTETFKTNICSTDNYKGGFLAAQYLYETGHQKPAYVTGLLDKVYAHRARMKGFCDGFKNRRVKIIKTGIGKEGGYKGALRHVSHVQNQDIDCIGVVNDLTAIGVIQALMEQGIRIPEDVSIIGYDNLPLTAALPFAFSSIELNFSKIYASALDLLLETMNSGEPVKNIIEPVLVPGESVIKR